MSVLDFLDAEHRASVEALPGDFLDLSDIGAARVALRRTLEEGTRNAATFDDVESSDRVVPGVDGAPDLALRTYRPTGADGPLPTMFWIHGGGLVLGDLTMDDVACRELVSEVGCMVASTDYRLAPEDPYPAAVEDCLRSLRWVTDNAGELGVDLERTGVGGTSAGAGLAAGLALLSRDRGGPALCFQYLGAPMIDDRQTTPSAQRFTLGNSDRRMWNREHNGIGWSAYLGERSGTDDVAIYAAPARAGVEQLAGAPPAFIAVGEHDMFRDEDIAYAQRLLLAGVSTELHVFPGAYHGSYRLAPNAEVSKRWRAESHAAVRRGLGL